MLLLDKKCSNEVINIGAGQEFEIKYFVKLICKIIDYPYKKISFNKKNLLEQSQKNSQTKN